MARSRRSRRSPPLPHAAREVRTGERSARTKIVICIDGDISEATEQYREGIGRVKEWCEEGGITVDVSDLFGPGCKVVTTRAGGALEFEVIYKGRSLIFLIQGRNLYIRGWRGRGKIFELADSENLQQNFTLDRNCIKLKTGLNYRELVGKGVENVPTGLFVLRKAFDKLWRHAGGENIDISKEVAIFAVHISEASRFPPILRFICDSFTNLGLSSLGKDPSNYNCIYVTKYSKASGAVMENIDRMKAGKEPFPINVNGLQNKSMEELVCDIGILFRDGYNAEDSNFEHEDPPSLPIYENTMSEIGAGVQRKRKRAQQTVSKSKKPKGGGGPKGGSVGERKESNGGGSMQRGQGLRGGGFGGSAASFHPGLKGAGFGGSAASFHTGGSKDRLGRSPASFHRTGTGHKDGVGRPGVSFHHTGEGLKGLLHEDKHTVTPSIGIGERVCFRSAAVRYFELPHSSHKYTSAEYQYMNVLAHRKKQIFPISPLPIRKTSPPLFSLLSPSSSLLRKKQEQMKAFPLLLDGRPHLHSRLSLSGLLKTRYLSRALRFIH